MNDVITELKREREKTLALQEIIAVQSQQIAEMNPKTSYYDIVLKCKDVVPISVISKDYGVSPWRMNCYLYERGVQYLQGRNWLIYQKYAELGYTNTKTYVRSGDGENGRIAIFVCWTQKGRLFLYDLLKSDGILPVIER